MANQEIREEAKKRGVPLWARADRLGVSEATMTRMLRHELEEEQKRALLELVKQEVEA